MAFEPIPCEACGSTGGVGPPELDAEQMLLCDVNAEGEVVGTALMVTVYDGSGTATGPPQPFNPSTGDPYVAVGTLMPCPGDTGCLEPVQFCFTSTTTGPVDHPGRLYDAVLPVNPGFALESIVVDGVVTPQNLVWDVNDSTGQAFADELETRLASLLPAAGTITVTPPGSQNCGTNPSQFAIHIECLRLDQDPPDVIRFNYNGGEDLIQNPAYNETPPLNPPVSQGNYGYHLLAREDDPGPFPGSPPAERADCTNVANRGWETNDSSRTFEIWGLDVSGGVTPTPRGTPIQEVNSDGGPVGGTTIWQTFQVTAGGNFNIRLVHGGRDPGETHTIKLSTGDTDFSGPGDLINNVTLNTPVVYSGGAWTVFNQVVALAPGVYTLSFQSNNPTGNTARGGLFTDMRAFVDVPGLFEDTVRDDETCVVTTEETTSTTVCEYWSPLCTNGDITAWKNAETGETLDNAGFWGQTPSPECCTATSSGGGGTVTPGNLVHAYLVCGVVGGIPTTLTRVVYTDQSGGVVASAMIGLDGGPVAPSTWTPGSCPPVLEVDQTLGAVCWNTTPPGPSGRTGFLSLDQNDNPVLYDENGVLVPEPYTILICADRAITSQILCDQGNDGHQFIRHYNASPIDGESAGIGDYELDGSTAYVPVGPVAVCGDTAGSVAEFVLCDNFTVGPNNLRISFVRKFFQDGDGVVISVVDLTVNGDPYVVQGAVGICDFTNDIPDVEGICYTLTSTGATLNAGWARHEDSIPNTPQTPNGIAFFTPTGVPIDPTVNGFTVVPCVNQQIDTEVQILCDSTPTRFLRRYVYDEETPGVPTVTNTALDGVTPFVPVGAVSICTQPTLSDFDFAEEILCDSNGTQFIRRFRFNSQTGVLDTTTNLTLAGGAFVPVGAVTLCSECCAIEIGQGCHTGGSGRYTALRDPGGTISLIDSVTGAAVLAVNVIPCPSADTLITLNSQGRLIADADAAWTPGADVVGVATSVTLTVLSGTANVVDQSGTALNGLPTGTTLTWSAEDKNVLLPPQSIDAIGGQTVVTWTQR